MKHLITIIGPTAIGKTALSIRLARRFNCDIVSCDSRQFFREMKIGTAVPTHDELAAARHHFIQNKSIFDNYTVGDFEKEAIAKIDELFESNDFVILVGGSGLYVDAILKGFDEFPEIDISIREQIRHHYEVNGIEWLQEKLSQLDLDYYKKLEAGNPQTLQNPQRLMRFVEVCIGTRKPYSSFLNQRKHKRSFIPILIGLEAERGVLSNRINQRVDQMMQDGLLEEARELYPNRKLNGLQTVGYRELFAFFDHEITLESAIAEIKKNTRRFAKRQLTWFRRNDKVRWFDFQANVSEIMEHIANQVQLSLGIKIN